MQFSELRGRASLGMGVAEQPAILRSRASVISRPSVSIVRRKRAHPGFSLIESMVVITMIGLMAATVMPAMSEMIANQRQHSIAVDIVSLARRARDAAVLGGKYAHAIVFEQNAGGGDGVVQIITGATSQCYRGTGVPIIGAADVQVPDGWAPTMGSVSLRGLTFGAHRVFATMEMPDGTNLAAMRVCYTPSGETWVFSGTLPGGGGEQVVPAVLRVHRQNAFGGAAGVPREIVFMPGGTPRLR
jgi:prepilin-type N-terminal cleavage/methylation domain-containing protein